MPHVIIHIHIHVPRPAITFCKRHRYDPNAPLYARNCSSAALPVQSMLRAAAGNVASYIYACARRQVHRPALILVCHVHCEAGLSVVVSPNVVVESFKRRRRW